MMHRWFSLALIAIALGLGSCTSTELDSASPETATISPAEAEGTAPPAPKTNNEDIANVNTAPATRQDSPGNSTPEPPEQTAENPALTSNSPSPEAAAPTDPEKPTETASITIDETICGAGGQEAYFETKTQEIYICKNEAAVLTYIATPKKKGNSQFLPAQKVQQGGVTGYIAMDDAKTYVVTPGGFQLQDSGKTQKSEKVIRRQLSQP